MKSIDKQNQVVSIPQYQDNFSNISKRAWENSPPPLFPASCAPYTVRHNSVFCVQKMTSKFILNRFQRSSYQNLLRAFGWTLFKYRKKIPDALYPSIKSLHFVSKDMLNQWIKNEKLISECKFHIGIIDKTSVYLKKM